MSVAIRAVWELKCSRGTCRWVTHVVGDVETAHAVADLHEQTHAKEAKS